MISFACQRIDLYDLVTCSFDLKKKEYELLLLMMKQSSALTIQEIARLLGVERSTVQKAMSHLYQKELVARHQINLPGGGYRFIYEVQDKRAIKKRLLAIIDGWHKGVVDVVNRW